ncbi:hypothetical protein [Ulvibacterium sp.]|uniref:hypothetical protein n=1 Tax=Ulvibacterium sp. TaxID=2665914 RepID=UPI003CC503BE
MKKILIVIWFILVSVSFLGYGRLGKIFYTSESAEYMTDVSNINLIYCLGALLTFLSAVLFIKRKSLKYICLFLCFSIWLLSTRKVAISQFYQGRLGVGWNCFLTDEFFMCNEESNCETTLAYDTTIEKISLWRVTIKNEKLNRTIFIGPLTWSGTVKMLEKNIGYGSYTK